MYLDYCVNTDTQKQCSYICIMALRCYMSGFNYGYHDLNVCYYGRPNCAEEMSHQSQATQTCFMI